MCRAIIKLLLLYTLGCFYLSKAFADELSFRGDFTWLNAVSWAQIRDSPLNRQNKVLDLPQGALVSQLRPNLKWEHPSIQLVLQPRVAFHYEAIEKAGKALPARAYSRSHIQQAYLQWGLSDSLQFAYGRQSYQWGPAETLSPSNQIFHESILQQNKLYETKGKNLARLNYSLAKELSLVLITEFQENKDEAAFQAGKDFASTSLAKLEYNWQGGASYMGIVLGGQEKGHGYLGEYAQIALPFAEGLSLYGDAAHQRGSQAYYPESQSLPNFAGEQKLTTLKATRQEAKSLYTLAALGIRYDYENGSILRLEYLINDAGYDKDQRQEVLEALRSRHPLQQQQNQQMLPLFLAPGLALPGKRYAYASLYAPDVLGKSGCTVTVRGLYALADRSASLLLTGEYDIGEQGTIFLVNTGNLGTADQELAGLSSQSHILGYRHVW